MNAMIAAGRMKAVVQPNSFQSDARNTRTEVPTFVPVHVCQRSQEEVPLVMEWNTVQRHWRGTWGIPKAI